MTFLLQVLLNGLSVGASYALVAVGLTLIFGAARVGNFAHGDFFMVGALTLALLGTGGFSYPVAALGAIVVSTLVATASYAAFRPLIDRGNAITLFVAAIAVAVIIQSLVQLGWGATPRNIASPLNDVSVQFGGVRTTAQRLAGILGAGAAFAALFAFLGHTQAGRSIRAVAQNKEAAQAAGIQVDKVRLLTFAVSGVLAGWAAVLMGPIYPVYPLMGLYLVLKAFAIVIVGGLGSIRGALICALLLGVLESLASAYVGLLLEDSIAFLAMIAILLVRPSGLFGKVGAPL